MPPGAAKGRSSFSSRVVLQEEEEEDGRNKEAAAGGAGSSIKKRAPNFDSAEDVVIARCWRNMTNDAKTGTDQTSDAFWQRLFLKFTTVMIEEQKRTQAEVNNHRSWKTLRSRWRRCIQKETMLFASVYRRVRAQEKSGWNEDDYQKEAMTRYRAMNGKNKDFAYLECWKVLKDEPKFMLMMKQTPNDEGVPAIVLTENENTGAADTEGEASAVTSVSEGQQGNKVRRSTGSFSNINGPPIGPSGRPMGVKKTKLGLKEALAVATHQRDIATERHEEVAELLTRIGARMNQLANRIDVQSSFLGSFVFLQMGETAKAHALADSGRNDLIVSKSGEEETNKMMDAYEEEDVDVDVDEDDEDNDPDDENEKENRNEDESLKKKPEKSETLVTFRLLGEEGRRITERRPSPSLDIVQLDAGVEGLKKLEERSIALIFLRMLARRWRTSLNIQSTVALAVARHSVVVLVELENQLTSTFVILV